MKILVTGGCGYIGSHTVTQLLLDGHSIISIDNFSRSFPEALDGIEKITGQKVNNLNLDLTSWEAIEANKEHLTGIDSIIHFAAYKSVGESMEKPDLYYRNNIQGMINILKLASELKIKSFIFSSSCSVYGNAETMPVTEQTPFHAAESPYGMTKQCGELLLQDFAARNSSTKCISLRYFNPAGAHSSGLIGEKSNAPTFNLIPIMMEVANGTRPELVVYGKNYPTPDGTCVRDYIYIQDLALAHTAALNFSLAPTMESNYEIFNVGSGSGLSVLEMIHTYETVTGEKLNYSFGKNRAGDVAKIYADCSKAEEILQWKPQHGIEDIIRTAIAWESKKN